MGREFGEFGLWMYHEGLRGIFSSFHTSSVLHYRDFSTGVQSILIPMALRISLSRVTVHVLCHPLNS
jgi:hypothetical protein